MNLYSIPPLLTLCCFAGLAVLTLRQGPRTKVKILFSLICVLGCFLYIDILFAFNLKSEKTALLISRIDHGFIVYLFPLYIHFFHEYLNISRRRWLVRGAYAFAFLMMCFTPTPIYIESMQKHDFGFFAKGGVLYPIFGLGGVLATIYVLVLIVAAIGREHSNARKNGLKYVLAGFGVMGLLNSLSVLTNLGYSVYPLGNFSFIPLTIFYIGLFKHDLFDMGLLIRKSLIYSLLTALITGLYALIITAANRIFSDFHPGGTIYLQMLFFLLVVTVFGPLKTRTQKFIDHLFYKGKYDYQKTLKAVSQIIAADRDLNEIAHRLMETLADAMGVKNCAFYLASARFRDFRIFAQRGNGRPDPASIIRSDDSALIRFLTTRPRPVVKTFLLQWTETGQVNRDIIDEMDALGAAVILPLTFSGTLTGFIAMGEKLSEDLFSREDMNLLETLAHQTALAIENARSYQAVISLNETLEKKVRERTQALEQALAEKEKTQEQLIRSESLAAIGQLVAGTAHELNNPLASVTSLIQSAIEDLTLMDEQSPPGEDLIDDLKFADKELGRAKSIVASLLGLSRQTQTYSEAVDMNTVVEDALRVLFNKVRHGAFDIVKDLSPHLPTIRGNFANLGQVVLNIIQNAIDAVGESGGKIFLRTRYDAAAGRVIFRCRDTGPGIPEKIRKDIFKPFFTTKTVGKGTGLGLYICHEIIQRHGGNLILEKGDREGAGFVVRLPVNDPEPVS